MSTSGLLVEQAEGESDLVVADIAARSPMQLFWRRLRQDRVALAALGFIILLVLCAILAPLIIKIVGVPGPNEQNSAALDSFGTPTGPSADHPFGVDNLGRDVFARVLYGARVSLYVAIVATTIAMVIGVTVGMTAAFYRGAVAAAAVLAPIPQGQGCARGADVHRPADLRRDLRAADPVDPGHPGPR